MTLHHGVARLCHDNGSTMTSAKCSWPCRGSVRVWLAAVFVCWLLPDRALAGLNSWTSNGPPGGGIGRLAIDPSHPQTLYATALGGVFKTTDGGLHWERSGSGLPANAGIASLAVDALVSDVLYAGTNQGGIFQSIDAGRTWEKVFEVESTFGQQIVINQIVIDPTDDRNVYAGTNRGVFRSRDRGSSWQITGLTTGVQCLAIDPSDPMVLYAGGSLGLAAALFRTEDSGISWLSWQVGGEIPHTGNSVFAVAVNPRNHGVLASTRTGILGAQPPSGRLASCLVFDPLDPNVVYACGSSEPFFDEGLGALKSVDGGLTWRSVGPGDHTWVTSVVVDPKHSGTIYAAVAGPAPPPGEGVFRSLDGGTRWEPVMNGLSAHFVWTVETPRSRPGEVYAGLGSSSPAWKSSDEGLSWTVASTGITSDRIGDFAIDPVTPRIVYAAGQEVWKSEDAGATWRKATLPLAIRYTLAIDPLHPYAVYAARSLLGPTTPGFSFDGGVYRSVDSGETWTFSEAGLENTAVFDLVVHPNGTLFAATGAGVYQSGDGGVSWFASTLTGQISSIQIDPLDLSTLHAGSFDGRVFKSIDRGFTWTAASTGPPGGSVLCVLVDPVRPRTVYAGTSDAGVFRSTDAGTSWFPLNTGLHVLRVNALAISAAGSVLHAATGGGGVFEFEFLPDRSFSRVPTRRPPSRTLPPRF